MPAVVLVIGAVFAGVAGQDSARVERQLETLLHREAQVDAATVSARDLTALADEEAGAPAAVHRIQAGVVVVGRVIPTRRGAKLAVRVYDGDGVDRYQTEVPLVDGALDRGGLARLRRELIPVIGELVSLQDTGPEEMEITIEPAPAPEPAAVVAQEPAAPAPEPAVADAPEPAVAGAPEATVQAAAAPAALHARAAIGVGLIQRSFTAGPATVQPYRSGLVGAVRLVGDVRPARQAALRFTVERTLDMTTNVDGEAVATTITRWDVAGSWVHTLAGVAVGAGLGVGRRTFVIESKYAGRSPDGDYTYLLLGLDARRDLGRSMRLLAHVAYEPVIAGEQSTSDRFGPARRWALAAGVSLELRLRPGLYVAAQADTQRFWWSWDRAGERGAGGAADGYFSAALAVGAEY